MKTLMVTILSVLSFSVSAHATAADAATDLFNSSIGNVRMNRVLQAWNYPDAESFGLTPEIRAEALKRITTLIPQLGIQALDASAAQKGGADLEIGFAYTDDAQFSSRSADFHFKVAVNRAHVGSYVMITRLASQDVAGIYRQALPLLKAGHKKAALKLVLNELKHKVVPLSLNGSSIHLSKWENGREYIAFNYRRFGEEASILVYEDGELVAPSGLRVDLGFPSTTVN